MVRNTNHYRMVHWKRWTDIPNVNWYNEEYTHRRFTIWQARIHSPRGHWSSSMLMLLLLLSLPYNLIFWMPHFFFEEKNGPLLRPGMLAYGYKKIVASSRSVIGSLNDSGVPAIWLPMVSETQTDDGSWTKLDGGFSRSGNREICKLHFDDWIATWVTCLFITSELEFWDMFVLFEIHRFLAIFSTPLALEIKVLMFFLNSLYDGNESISYRFRGGCSVKNPRRVICWSQKLVVSIIYVYI